jgi:hypothetical protein
MFDNLPVDIELLIYKTYFSKTVIPELGVEAKKVSLKNYYSKTLLPELVSYAIMEQAARIIYSTYDNGYTEYYKLDAIFYHLIQLHNDKILDIFCW